MAQRVRILARAVGYSSSTAFAAFLGVSVQRLNQVENGLSLGIDMAMTLVQKTGVSLDWLYYGKTDGISLGLAHRLGDIEVTDAKVRAGR